MYRFNIVILLLINILPGYTQDNTGAISLEQALSRAMVKRVEMQAQQINTSIAENEVRKINSKKLPQITGDVDMRYNSQLQTNVLPGAAFGVPGAPDRLIQFGTKYNTLAGVSGTQNIFNPINAGDKKIAKAQEEYQHLNENLTAIEVRQATMEAYFYALLWKEKLALSDSNLRRANAIFVTGESQLMEGAITKYDFNKFKIDLENAKAEMEKNKNNLQLSLSELWFQMGEDSLPGEVKLLDDIENLFKKQPQDLNAVTGSARTELQLEKSQKQIFDLNVKKHNLTYLPSLYIYGNYSVQNLSNKNPVDGSRWYPFNYVGLHASIPIYDGGLKSRNKSEYILRSRSSLLNYQKLSTAYNQEARSAAITIRNAEADLNYQQQNLGLANELYQIDSDRLKDGMIKQNDLTTTYYTLLQTQTNYVNAVYNYLVAVVRFKKAQGTL